MCAETIEITPVKCIQLVTGTVQNSETNIAQGNYKVSLFKNGIQILERDGFRIQQEIPHDYTKNAILEGSQIRKLKYANLTIFPIWIKEFMTLLVNKITIQ